MKKTNGAVSTSTRRRFSCCDRRVVNFIFATDLPYDRESIPQAIGKCRQNQQSGEVNENTSDQENGKEKDQETNMPDGVGVIGFEFLAHGKNHSTAEQANRTLDNYKNSIGYSVFPQIPWLKMNKKEIGFTQDA